MNTKCFAAASVCTLVWTLVAGAAELAPGAAMPMAGHKMRAADGKQVSVQDAGGKQGVVVAFWCNHCPVVKRYRDKVIQLAGTYQKKGIGFIAVNANDPAKVKGDSFDAMVAEAKKRGYTFPYVVDAGSRLARAYGAGKTPHIFFFDAKNRLVYVGAVDSGARRGKPPSKDWLKDAMDAVIAGKPVPEARSRAFGCSIKWYKDSGTKK
jgi:thiol-disulfide isomerase/thioredoxin